jgi:hypothetical protein
MRGKSTHPQVARRGFSMNGRIPPVNGWCSGTRGRLMTHDEVPKGRLCGRGHGYACRVPVVGHNRQLVRR